MPLLDHFHPPLSQRRHWDSFHAAWAEAMARQLNDQLLPARYFAEAHVKLSVQVESDVGTFRENGALPVIIRGNASQFVKLLGVCVGIWKYASHAPNIWESA